MKQETFLEKIIGSIRLKNYLVGYGLAIILTALAFSLVMFAATKAFDLYLFIFILAILQALVHLFFFLHMKPSGKKYWNWLALIYTLILLAILSGASIWVMYHLNKNMMIPSPPEQEKVEQP